MAKSEKAKRGRGRPEVALKLRQETMSLRIPQWMIEDIDMLIEAEGTDITRSEFIRKILVNKLRLSPPEID